MSNPAVTAPSKPAKPREKVRVSATKSFRDGLSKPTRLSLLLAISVAIAISALFANLVDERWMVRHGHWFSSGEGDVHSDVTLRALALKNDTPAPRPMLVLAGHVDSERQLKEEPWTGQCPNGCCDLIDLRAPNQTLYETYSLLDQLRPVPASRVIYLASPRALRERDDAATEMAKRSRIGVRSASATIDMMHQGIAVVPLRGNYFVDNQSYLLARAPVAARNLAREVTGWRVLSPQKGRASVPPPLVDGGTDEDERKKLDSLGRMLDRLHFVGFERTVVVLQPDSSSGNPAFRQKVEEMVRSRNGEFVPCDNSKEGSAGSTRSMLADLRSRLCASEGEKPCHTE